MAESCACWPAPDSGEPGPVSVRLDGIGTWLAKEISLTRMAPFTGTVKRSDCPYRVVPFAMHAARTRTWPVPAGTFVSTQTPLASTCAGRFRLSRS